MWSVHGGAHVERPLDAGDRLVVKVAMQIEVGSPTPDCAQHITRHENQALIVVDAISRLLGQPALFLDVSIPNLIGEGHHDLVEPVVTGLVPTQDEH